MTVGIVPRDPLAEPQHMRHAELLAEDRFEVGAPEAGIPDLDLRIEQAFFRGQERSVSVEVDAPALEHHVSGAASGWKHPQLESRCHPGGNPIVLLPVGILGPRVEAKPRNRDFRARLGTSYENRAEVAGPPAVRREPEELDLRGGYADVREQPSRLALVHRRVDQDADDLAWDERAHDFAVHPRDRAKLAGPIAGVVRPADPRGVVRLPFGGHTEAEGRRGVGPRHYR